MSMAALDDILSRVSKLRRTGEGWIGCCPAHDDRHASLSVGLGNDGRVLLHCFAGCSIDAIVAALGLGLQDLFADTRTTPSASRATVQRAPANRDSSADSSVGTGEAGGDAGVTVAPLQPD